MVTTNMEQLLVNLVQGHRHFTWCMQVERKMKPRLDQFSQQKYNWNFRHWVTSYRSVASFDWEDARMPNSWRMEMKKHSQTLCDYKGVILEIISCIEATCWSRAPGPEWGYCWCASGFWPSSWFHIHTSQMVFSHMLLLPLQTCKLEKTKPESISTLLSEFKFRRVERYCLLAERNTCARTTFQIWAQVDSCINTQLIIV